MPLSIVRPMLAAVLLLLALNSQPAWADCLGQCESQHQTCLRGCTSANAKACIDSCFRGSSACRSRCRSDAPMRTLKTGAILCVPSVKVCVKNPS